MILVHELTHHLQNKNDVVVACPLLYEPAAYELMKTWAKENEVLYTGPSEFTIIARFSQCPDE